MRTWEPVGWPSGAGALPNKAVLNAGRKFIRQMRRRRFLSGVTEQEVYVMQRKGFERAGAEHKGCKLDNGLYGLRQARASSSHTLCSARTLSTRLATSPSRHATTIASPEKKPWRCARRHTQTRAP
jgi:hypothetical protein